VPASTVRIGAPMSPDLRPALEAATAAALEAGELLRRERHRPDGPRGHGDKAEADVEAEHVIRSRLVAAFPGWAFLGEETGPAGAVESAAVWLVDPNDGTRDYLRGQRGSAVSIGLLVEGRPRLGVVFAFAYPDDDGDLFAWAEGCGPLHRNRRPVVARLSGSLAADDTVLVSSAGDTDPEGNLACVTPARYRTLSSIAHRLALVAAGEAAAAVSLHGLHAWDYAAGQALLRSAGAVLLDESGQEVTYEPSGESRREGVFGARPDVAVRLAARPWHTVGMRRETDDGDGFPARLRPGRAVSDPGLLSRAQGCLLGQVAGDSLGALVEFQSREEIARSFLDGPRRLRDGGRWDLLGGQPTDDSEMALALARATVVRKGFDPGAAAEAYREWVRSEPFDVGNTVRAALYGRSNPASQANGSLMRASPLGVLAHRLPPAAAAELARQDSALTHPNPVCGDACAAFVVAVAHAVARGDGPEGAWRAATEWAADGGAALLVRDALAVARTEPPACDEGSEGWVKIALQNAFFELLHAPSLEEGVVATVRRGGDTDTNAAVAGALLGAVHGRGAVPSQWRAAVLSCRAHRARAHHPRPRTFWPADVLELAERLLVAG
jgi:ADP-ribosyl-[dinitrogen reductase] hydrolase